MTKWISIFAAAAIPSCAFYDYPEREIVVKEGELAARLKLVKVNEDNVKLGGATPITLLRGERMSVGNNNHLLLVSTDVKRRQATFKHSWLEWHGGLTLPPF